MKDKTLKDLYDFYAPEDKNDFYIAYLYLKHMDLFLHNALKLLSIPPKEMQEKPDPSLDAMLHSYVRQIGELAISRETNIYHGKVMTHNDARKLVTLDKGINIPVSERVVPYRIARDIILENPEAISVGRCACRSNQVNPCIPESDQELCLIMGDPFASFIAAHNPNFRSCTQDEAAEILERAHQRGDVHTAYFKKELGKRLMAICNCCSCCCMGMVMWNKLNGAVPFLAPSGYAAVVADTCTGCGDCADKCPFHAIAIDGQKQKAAVDREKCMGCGVCEDMCPGGSINLGRDPSKGEPLDINELMTV